VGLAADGVNMRGIIGSLRRAVHLFGAAFGRIGHRDAIAVDLQIEAAALARMAGGTGLLDDQQQRVAIAIDPRNS
jgi:hypothetical protein